MKWLGRCVTSVFISGLLLLSTTFLPAILYGQKGVLKGKILDGSTNGALYGVSISTDSSSVEALSVADGCYELKKINGTYTIFYRFAGFRTKVISNVRIVQNEITSLDIILSPIAQANLGDNKVDPVTDSLQVREDTLKHNSFYRETRLAINHAVMKDASLFCAIPYQTILPGTDKNGAQLLKRLNGVVVADNPFSSNSRSLIISGLGNRYNQLLVNDVLFNSVDPTSRAYPLEVLPVEAIEEVSVVKTTNGSLPVDVVGGTVKIQTKELPDRSFFYIQAGGGFSDNTYGKDFYSNKRGRFEIVSFPGSTRNLPDHFPTTRSRVPLSNLNVQEKFDKTRQFSNNLAPINQGTAAPNNRVVMGGGKLYHLKRGVKIGLIAFVTQQKTEDIDQSQVQVSPNVINNRYPFLNDVPLIGAYSNDINYKYLSQLGSTFNATAVFGRNKISFKNFFGNQLLNHYQQRNNIFKPDEDTLANTGHRYITEQRSFWNTQLSGHHAMGEGGKFKINWVAGYTYYQQQNPDERNFLLRQDSADKSLFSLAKPIASFSRPQDASNPDLTNINRSFTNSARLWRNYTDHNISGALNLAFTFNAFHQPQVLKGGVYMQSISRIFYSDLFQVQGGNYTSLDKLLSPDRYYPMGTTVESYFTNYSRETNLGVTDLYFANGSYRGNYTASSQLGASYLQFESKLSKNLSLNGTVRIESNNQLTSSTQYEYLKGFKKPRLTTLDQNTSVIQFNFLPSLQLRYKFFKNWMIDLAYAKTVNRPQLQELAFYRYYDASMFMVKTGNPFLYNSTISNYDARISWIPFATTHVSFSGFYKDLVQPIENVITAYAGSKATLLSTPFNLPAAKVVGWNFSFDTKLNFSSSPSWLGNISLFGDLHWLKSKVAQARLRTINEPIVSKHPLTGSPNYTINGGIIIKQPRFPSVTLLYNETGDYIAALGSGARYILSNGNNILAIPDFRVKGRQQLDIQISQVLLKSRVQIIAGAHNVLGSDYIEYQDLNGNEKFDSPLTLTNRGGNRAFSRYFQSGIDNTIIHVKAQKAYYVALSYLFK
jgi:hypothetical protein